MGGVIGFASSQDCVMDLFFGTDYHSHLGTKRGGMCVLQEDGFNRSIHNIDCLLYTSGEGFAGRGLSLSSVMLILQ